jgi:hypothetical protein
MLGSPSTEPLGTWTVLDALRVAPVTSEAMHPRLAELLEYVDAETEALRAAYEAVPAERRATRPAPDRWSPAEVIHHLAIVERRVTSRLAQLIEQARALAPETDTAPLTPAVRMARLSDRTRRFVTSEAGEPRDTVSSRVWEEFEEVRRGFRRVIAEGDGLALGAVSAPHPALGIFSAYEWIAFAGAHAARHADQIREMTPALRRLTESSGEARSEGPGYLGQTT